MIIAVDFDGTLCEDKFPLIGKPKTKIVDYVKKLQHEHTIILWTCRTGKMLKKAVIWCSNQGVRPDFVNENASWVIKKFNNDCRKIYADIYIDDKAICAMDL